MWKYLSDLTQLIDKRVCVVRLDGCMADVRSNERWGYIKDLTTQDLYPVGPTQMVVIDFDDGEREIHPLGAFVDEGTHLERQN